eukprot:6362790-Amphidinium_carterae.1
MWLVARIAQRLSGAGCWWSLVPAQAVEAESASSYRSRWLVNRLSMRENSNNQDRTAKGSIAATTFPPHVPKVVDKKPICSVI